MNDSVLVKLDQLFDKLKTASDEDDWNTVRSLVAQIALVKPKSRRSGASMSPRMMVGSCLRTSMMTGRRAHGMTARLITCGMAIDSMRSGRLSAKRSRLKPSHSSE